MYVTTDLQGVKARISLVGRFTFDNRLKFKAVVDPLTENTEVQQLDIDLSGVDYMDSAGLGMLIILRKRIPEKCKISLLNPKPYVVSVLRIANLQKIFAIEPPISEEN